MAFLISECNYETVARMDFQCFGSSEWADDIRLMDMVWWFQLRHSETKAFNSKLSMMAGFCALGRFSDDVYFLARCAIHEDFRQRGLHKRMIRFRHSKIRDLRRGVYSGPPKIVTYAEHSNIWSLRALISCGYRPTWNSHLAFLLDTQDSGFVPLKYERRGSSNA